ncbi:phosphoesterase PA-phosphatase related protein [Fibrisoma limi BUZ 3]|uniref:Phosphoesterase PA-phosphatase related protein n=1 Tax=Fibrisoma limi BUZ 3 TaxID=1185876 RepID=I2GBC3_9BACT|nr:phosphatase PAP2 family protein [Fibrisoma limi]CCH51197.1 phosphoesterase PA-phosphatase related protein [Fibrisoma limi BUZ 3]
MKRILRNILILNLSVLGLSSVLTSCDKTIDEPQRVGYAPASVDEKAGTWKTYILTAPTDVTVSTPASVSSTEYQAELTDLKSKSASLTREQQEAVTYWGAGAVYRWNEIARELAARYNVPPASTPDGKYPNPDPNNPLADPRFPFANPPYTARALSYLSVAQYDALVSAWHYKYQFGRSAPSKVDGTVRAALPTSALPSYPSEDAVVAAASYTVLKAMFPGEVPFLDAKLAEHRNSRLWAGMNVASDLVAGADLGSQVAAKVMARARTDGMSAANNQALTTDMIAAAKSRGLSEIWVSQEIPARPPMLPNYGAVAPWNFDKATIAKLRPGPPPALDSPDFKKALDELKAINGNQTREQARIANYWADGVGSYTPPGHWHRTAADAAHEARFSEIRMARTLALVGTTLMDAGVCCWETKFYYYYPRPQQFGLKTSVGLPNFPSYTSGHSTFSAAAATVLGYVFPDRATEFWSRALEASDSRIYGLIHYRFDCEAGLTCGKNIAKYAIERGQADRSGL